MALPEVHREEVAAGVQEAGFVVLEGLALEEEDVVLRAVLREVGMDLAQGAVVEGPEGEEGAVGEVDFSRIETNRRHEYRFFFLLCDQKGKPIHHDF